MPFDPPGSDTDADTDADAASLLRAAARFGPYFVWEPWDGGAGWRPLRDLLDADVIADRVAVGRQTLARVTGLAPEDIGERVIASIMFLGLASRLISPPLAAAAAGGAVPVPDFDRMWWRPVEAGPVPIAWRGLASARAEDEDAKGDGAKGDGDPATVAQALTRTVIRNLVEPVLEVFGRRFVLSRQVLWGNVASAFGGAAGMIADAMPAYAPRCAAIVEQVLELPPLRGSATLVRPDPDRARWFLVRRNCCLYYRIPGGGICGDCVLTPDEVRRRQWRA